MKLLVHVPDVLKGVFLSGGGLHTVNLFALVQIKRKKKTKHMSLSSD